jgi:hypothetical protein
VEKAADKGAQKLGIGTGIVVFLLALVVLAPLDQTPLAMAPVALALVTGGVSAVWIYSLARVEYREVLRTAHPYSTVPRNLIKMAEDLQSLLRQAAIIGEDLEEQINKSQAKLDGLHEKTVEEERLAELYGPKVTQVRREIEAGQKKGSRRALWTGFALNVIVTILGGVFFFFAGLTWQAIVQSSTTEEVVAKWAPWLIGIIKTISQSSLA